MPFSLPEVNRSQNRDGVDKGIVESRLNKKILGLDCSATSPISPGAWPQFRAGEKMERYLGMTETQLPHTARENHNHHRTPRGERSWHQSFGFSKKTQVVGALILVQI